MQVFGDQDPITADNAANAVAAYERTLITPNSPYDRYVKGEKTALSEQQVRGMEAFDQLGCTSCHSGANFDGPSLPVGQPVLMKLPTFPDNPYVAEYHLMDDKGRAEQTGYKDGNIKLINLASKREVYGKVLDSGTVLVKF